VQLQKIKNCTCYGVKNPRRRTVKKPLFPLPTAAAFINTKFHTESPVE